MHVHLFIDAASIHRCMCIYSLELRPKILGIKNCRHLHCIDLADPCWCIWHAVADPQGVGRRIDSPAGDDRRPPAFLFRHFGARCFMFLSISSISATWGSLSKCMNFGCTEMKAKRLSWVDFGGQVGAKLGPKSVQEGSKAAPKQHGKEGTC